MCAVTTLSLILCLATSVMWVRSYICPEAVRYRSPSRERYVEVGSHRGQLYVESIRKLREDMWPYVPADRNDPGVWSVRESEGLSWQYYDLGDFAIRRWGFVLVVDGKKSVLINWGGRWDVSVARRPATAIGIPYWLPATLTALAPVVVLRRVLRIRRRRKLGLCLKCGYDLRATPNRCPECGTVPDPRPNPP